MSEYAGLFLFKISRQWSFHENQSLQPLLAEEAGRRSYRGGCRAFRSGRNI